MQQATLRFYAELNDFLPETRRYRRLTHCFEPGASIKEMIEDLEVPHTHVDLVSYSAWDTQDDSRLLRRALDYIAKHTPDREPFGDRNVYIGEFGSPENDRSEEHVRRILPGVIDAAVDWGCLYVIYWQLYCNEARRQPVRDNDDVRGFWLKK